MCEDLMLGIKRPRKLREIAHLNYSRIVSKRKVEKLMRNCKNYHIKQIFLGQKECSLNQILNIYHSIHFFCNKIIKNSESDPDVNFYQNNISNVETNY